MLALRPSPSEAAEDDGDSATARMEEAPDAERESEPPRDTDPEAERDSDPEAAPLISLLPVEAL